jgi:hypothetical protein
MGEKLLFKGIVGSQAFGTATPTSDVDHVEIFMCDNNDLLGFKYKEHDDLDKDYRRYELNKYMKMLMNGNPNACEILNLPVECCLFETPEWKELKKHKAHFITKKLSDTFAGYAKTQINKARGLNKKANWELQRVERKDILDFCYVLPLDGSDTQAKPFRYWSEKRQYKHTNCGLVKIDHLKDSYLLYTGEVGKYLGLVRTDKNNDVVLSNVEKGDDPIGILYFNKDGYSTHCKDYNQYQEWLKNRSQERFDTNKAHGQLYDSKHIMHVVRLLKTARDIAETGNIVVRRSPEEVQYLLSIKRGEIDLKSLVDWAEQEVPILNNLFDNSKLPNDVDAEFCHKLVVKLRTRKYIKKESSINNIFSDMGSALNFKNYTNEDNSGK